jgi:hypothetical protein
MEPRVDSTSISFPNLPGIPNISLSLKFSKEDNRIIKEIMIYSQNKRFLTSYQCCGNCTKYAIDSLVDYRNFLVKKRIEVIEYDQRSLKIIIDQILKNIELFLNFSEDLDVQRSHRELSFKLDELRNIILSFLFELSKKTGVRFPLDLNRMRK